MAAARTGKAHGAESQVTESLGLSLVSREDNFTSPELTGLSLQRSAEGADAVRDECRDSSQGWGGKERSKRAGWRGRVFFFFF